MKKEIKILIFLLIVVGSLALFYFRGILIQNKIEDKIAQKESLVQKNKAESFRYIDLLAKSAMVFDPNTNNIIYVFHENKSLPLASITKIMTALVALENMPKETTITIEQEAISEEGDNGLFPGEKWGLINLIKFMLASSSNDAAKALSFTYDEGSDKAFVRLMNQKAKDLNMLETTFYNESGLDLDEKHAGAYSSAKDVVTLINDLYVKYKDIFESIERPEISIESLNNTIHKIKNTNILLENDSTIKASKTGFTDLAGGNLAVIFEAKPGYNLIAVVLGSTYDGRFQDIKKLMLASRNYLRNAI